MIPGVCLWELFWCVAVRVANKHTCTMFGGVPLRSMSGYLAAFSAAESPVGSVDCPWLLDIQPGQHVNITVYGGLTLPHNQLGSYCLVALVVHDDNKTSLLPGCTQLRSVIILDQTNSWTFNLYWDTVGQRCLWSYYCQPEIRGSRSKYRTKVWAERRKHILHFHLYFTSCDKVKSISLLESQQTMLENYRQ